MGKLGDETAVYQLQTGESLQGWPGTDQSYLENTKSSLANVQTLGGPNKRSPREAEAAIKL